MAMKKYILLIILTVTFCHSTFARTLDDEGITSRVQALLMEEKDIPHNKIKVKTKNAIVELSGSVDTRLQANRAIEIAAGVTSVKDVRANDLRVKSSKEFLSDAYITAKAKGKIKYLAVSGSIKQDYKLHIETTNSVVHIFGDVADDQDIKTIKEATMNIIDVHDVKMNVKCSKHK
ncbi:MAG: hypothetical protein Tsb006_1150 [Rickettsiaceae bacterium]